MLKRTGVIAATTLAALGLTTVSGLTAADANSEVTVSTLRAAGMVSPIGIDQTSPQLSWKMTSEARGASQTAYRVQVASSAEKLAHGEADLWDTGQVESTAQAVSYGGKDLQSRQRAWWRVAILDHSGTETWSEPTSFEIGLLSPDDWSADWIGNSDWLLSQKTPPSITVAVPETTARFVKLNVTELGLPLAEQPQDSRTRIILSGDTKRFPELTHRLQLAEIRVKDSSAPEVNHAAGRQKHVTVSDTETVRKQWEPGLIADGLITSNPQEESASGFQSATRPTADTSEEPVWITIDLGEAKQFNEIELFPRTDTLTADGKVANFPVDFTVESTNDIADPFAVLASVEDLDAPENWLPEAMPIFAKDFVVDQDILDARLYISGAGIYVPSINGERVGDAVLQPGNTDLRDRIEYAVYDVSDLIVPGANAIGVELGNGAANALHTNGRYRKFARTSSELKLIAQLEITRADGSTAVIGSDGDWRTALGPTTSSNWYGGEDYDARREIAGWNTPGTNRTDWAQVAVVAPPTATGKLVSRRSEPIRVVEELPATEISRPDANVRLYDIGRNVAGLPQIKINAPAGTTLRVYPAESMSDGHVDQTFSNVGAPIWDQFTSNGKEQVWHPEFNYHAFRYIEVVGIPEEASLEVTGLRVMADNPSAGSLQVSDEILQGIHNLTKASLENNMMSVLTDAPSREKLGWLEQTHLVFDTIARNYDVEAYMSKVLIDIADGQEESGVVPSTVPDYVFLAGSYRDDPNWGGALVRVPLKHYKTYGDDAMLRQHYGQMKRYLEYLEGVETRWTAAGTYDYGLGDWFSSAKPATTRALVGTFGVWAIADGLAEVAEIIGQPEDAKHYAERANALAEIAWSAFYDADQKIYGGDDMGAIALALDMGAVPEELREEMETRLVELIEAQDWHFVIGEITFPSILRALTEAGREDVIVKVAQQTTAPSLGYQVVNGNTSLGETWDGGSGQSQSHFMLGAMDAWLMTRLPGIEQQDGSVGFKELLIQPAITGGLKSAAGEYNTPQGLVKSSWVLGDEALVMDVTVPANSSAEIRVPLYMDDAGDYQVPFANGTIAQSVTSEYAVFNVSAGEWKFTSPFAQIPTKTTIDASSDPSTVGEDANFAATVALETEGNERVAFGQVQFLLDGDPLGGPVEISNGVAASQTASGLKEGVYQVTAEFTGTGYAKSSTTISHEVVAERHEDSQDAGATAGSSGSNGSSDSSGSGASGGPQATSGSDGSTSTATSNTGGQIDKKPNEPGQNGGKAQGAGGSVQATGLAATGFEAVALLWVSLLLAGAGSLVLIRKRGRSSMSE